MKQLSKFCIVLLALCFPLSAFAELPMQLKEDFSSLSGYVIMSVGEEFLIDLDASKGLREGDILSIVTPGEKIIHPVTNKVLGTLDSAKAFLRVTRLKSGYSYAKIVSGDYAPIKGDQIKRFELVPAKITGGASGSDLGSDIQAQVPHLDWLESESGQALLSFVLSGDSLIVKDASGKVLRSYAGLSASDSVVPVPSIPAVSAPAAVIPADKAEPIAVSGIVRSEQPTADVWMGPNLSDNPIGLVVGDFDKDGRQETAIAMESYLLIVEISQGKQSNKAKVEFPTGTKLLSLDAIDLDGNGTLELYLSASRGTELSSQVVEFANGAYQRIEGKLPWFLTVAELPGLGKVLLGQTLGHYEDPYGEPRFLVNRTSAGWRKGQTVSLPQRVNLFSFEPLASTNQSSLYAYITTGDYLKVVDSLGDELWESDTYFGGTEVSFYSSDKMNRELVEPVYIPQRLVKTSEGEVLAVQNEGIRAMRRFRDFKKGRIVALKWNGFAMQESWRTTDQNGYVADFALADADNDGRNEAVMVVKYQKKGLFRKGRSTVVIYELPE